VAAIIYTLDIYTLNIYIYKQLSLGDTMKKVITQRATKRAINSEGVTITYSTIGKLFDEEGNKAYEHTQVASSCTTNLMLKFVDFEIMIKKAVADAHSAMDTHLDELLKCYNWEDVPGGGVTPIANSADAPYVLFVSRQAEKIVSNLIESYYE